MTRRRLRRRHVLAIVLAIGLLAAGAIWSNVLGVGTRFHDVVQRVERRVSLLVDPPPDRPIAATVWRVEGWPAAMLTAVFWMGWLIALLSTFQIYHFELFGVRQVVDALRGAAGRMRHRHRMRRPGRRHRSRPARRPRRPRSQHRSA